MLRPATIVAVVALSAMSWPVAWAESVRDTLYQGEQTWADLWNAKDAAGLAMTYTEDALRLPPDASRTQGRAAIQAHLQEEFDAGLTNLKLEPTDAGNQGNLAWLVGNYSVDYPTEKGAMGTATGNYVVVYRKEADGVWRTVIETWQPVATSVTYPGNPD